MSLIRSLLVTFFIAALCATADVASSAPRITSIQMDGGNIEVTVDVPAGVARIVLEGCRRSDLHAWVPRGVQQVSGAGSIRFVVPACALAGMEMFRVRADQGELLPASFYSGKSEFEGELLGSDAGGGVAVVLNGAPLRAFSTGADSTALRSVEESDIWRARGDRLYFFNASRGLQIIDIADPDRPALRGVLSLPGDGEQMYVLDDTHVLLLLHNRCDGGASTFVAVVDVTGDQPRETARLPLKGSLLETRLVGTALYVASHTWEPQDGTNDIWEEGIAVSAFDFAQPDQPVAQPTLARRGFGGVLTATDSYLFVATSDEDRPWWTQTLHVFDITDPTGVVRPVTEIPLSGILQDKFKIHQHGDLVAVVTEGTSDEQVWRTELTTYRLLPATQNNPRWTRLGGVELGERESLFATRFDGDRAYIVTYLRVDPLWVVDFSDPAQPTIKGKLEIPGWSTYIHPMGDRLFTVGVDDTNGRRVAAQLFDVADPAKPTLLSKVVLGDHWSSSEALNDEKALGIFPEDGLALLPFSMERDGLWTQGVQFLDLGRDTLTARGAFESSQIVPRRTLVRGERVLAISNRELLTVDATDRDHPALSHTLELGYPVDRVLPIGDWLVEFSGTGIRVSATSLPSVSVKQYAFDDLPVLGATVEGGKIHVLQGRSTTSFGLVLHNAADPAADPTNRGFLRHVVLDTTHLPELAVSGVATNGTDEIWLTDAKPLWPLPGLLVWSVHSGSQHWWWDIGMPVLRAFPAAPVGQVNLAELPGPRLQVRVPFAAGAVVQPLINMAVPAVIGIRPWYPFHWTPRGQTLVAVDVREAEAPRFLSETALARNVSAVSDGFAADGLVFFSRATHETEIVATNFYVYTNQIWVTVTNLVWKTNIVSTPVIVTETNFSFLSTPLAAVKLSWPASLTGSRLAAGYTHSLALDGEGRVLAWGGNRSGAIGPSQPEIVTAPTPVAVPSPMAGIASGPWQSFALDAAGVVWQWGSSVGPLPPPLPGMPLPDFATPQSVSLPTAISTIAAGYHHALALAADGRLWAWGLNTFGQLGLGHRDDAADPQLLDQTGFVAVAAGTDHSLAIDANSRVLSWGRNNYGQLGRAGAAETPALIEAPDGMTFRGIAGGLRHSLALASDGAVWTWGTNDYGQLGPREPRTESGPMHVRGLPAIRAIAAGWVHNLALAENGEVWFVGKDPGAGVPVAARVEPLRNVVMIAAGVRHSLALDAEGALFVWGDNLPVVGGAGEAIRLSLASEVTNVWTHTDYVLQTNVFQQEEITQRLQAELVTNAIPVYRHWNRHYLDVVDYQQNPAAPALREPASLPGLLQGLSHNGAVLYTVATEAGDQDKAPKTELSALAYDSVKAHLIATLTLSTNADEITTHIAVNPNSVVVVARDGSREEGSRQFECWRLAETGQFGLLGALDRQNHTHSLNLLDGLAVLRTDIGLELVDFAEPRSPIALPVNANLNCIWYDPSRVRGDREAGVWLPAGDLGSLLLWRP